jgi:hypothetical protein
MQYSYSVKYYSQGVFNVLKRETQSSSCLFLSLSVRRMSSLLTEEGGTEREGATRKSLVLYNPLSTLWLQHSFIFNYKEQH